MVVGKLDDDQVPVEVTLADFGWASMDEKPTAERCERCVDSLEVLGYGRAKGYGLHVCDRVRGHRSLSS